MVKWWNDKSSIEIDPALIVEEVVNAQSLQKVNFFSYGLIEKIPTSYIFSLLLIILF